nr:immunoglobulin light chain junction region [Macaca mulatta]
DYYCYSGDDNHGIF